MAGSEAWGVRGGGLGMRWEKEGRGPWKWKCEGNLKKVESWREHSTPHLLDGTAVILKGQDHWIF